MTIEEATDLLSEMIINCNLPSSTDPKRFLKSDALAVAIDCLQIESMYRWHDLQKYPEDLPIDDRRVLLCGPKGGFDIGRHRSENWFWLRGGKLFKAIAWREIEPFEGSEE